MLEIDIRSNREGDLLHQLNNRLHGALVEKDGIQVLNFDNAIGKGIIQVCDFDRGLSMSSLTFSLDEELGMVFKSGDISKVLFIFISEGEMTISGEREKKVTLNAYQNIIVSHKDNSDARFIFPKGMTVNANFIGVRKIENLQDKEAGIKPVQELLSSIIKDHAANNTFYHLGNFNLEIAGHIHKLNHMPDGDSLKRLVMEGRLYLMLALHLKEHHNYQNHEKLPETLGREDIKRIRQLAEFMQDNISEPLTVAHLSEISGLTSKKLQLGFRLLFSKSVNSYVRHIKLEFACEQLRNSDHTISEIVYMIGFKSRSYFSKIFEDRYGILPMEYRKKLRR